MSCERVMIAGAAGNIGMAIANALMDTGADLLLADKDLERLEAATAHFQRDRFVAVALDASSSEDWDRVANDPEAGFSRLDAAVLAFGNEGPVARIEDITEPEFNALMSVNVTGVWLGLKACIPPMKARRRGAIVALSSIAGRMGVPLCAAYSASKHAVVGLVRSAAREVAAEGIRVNAIAPGPVESELMERLDRQFLQLEPNRFGGRPNAADSVPIRRYVKPSEVADLAVFLCSEKSSGCTGAVFAVDGGVGTW